MTANVQRAPRDFSTISPSAKAILLVRSQTTLPYARAAAEILCGPEAVADTERQMATSPDAAGRRIHFETRARSVDDALARVDAERILELGAGLSFRGLAMVERADVEYVDTDLPAMIENKRALLPRLSTAPRHGTLRVEPLDALDEAAFAQVAESFRAGPVVVVNEGLLMYLDEAEKRRLAANVRRVLALRGGAWITADIYVRTAETLFRDPKARAFVEAHRIDEKKFENFAQAERFFVENGFSIQHRIAGRRETWTLRAS
jgi:O-methyltransferase involved in polyketide biosynthesis